MAHHFLKLNPAKAKAILIHDTSCKSDLLLLSSLITYHESQLKCVAFAHDLRVVPDYSSADMNGVLATVSTLYFHLKTIALLSPSNDLYTDNKVFDTHFGNTGALSYWKIL